ncbi:MAG: hypothetical protein NWF05_08655 [Candidatus Bathyarchaeota archaeon]|nr:hypothetical protein [Candidatus Bathyarchaeota archaeon]
MLSDMLELKNLKPRQFQVFFLRNDDSQAVEVHETGRVDFITVQQHLERGESVFITSKESQKVPTPPQKKPRPSVKSRLVTAFYFDKT